MRRLIFLVEEESMAEILEIILPKLLTPDIGFLTVPHEGKTDLERSIPRKLRAWKYPGDSFIILRDNDGADCLKIKSRLLKICEEAGRPDTLIRIVCQELESWFLGDLQAIEKAFNKPGLAKKYQSKKKMRNPDMLTNASQEIEKLLGGYGKVNGSRLIAAQLSLDPGANTSPSFQAFLKGIRRLAGTGL